MHAALAGGRASLCDRTGQCGRTSFRFVSASSAYFSQPTLLFHCATSLVSTNAKRKGIITIPLPYPTNTILIPDMSQSARPECTAVVPRGAQECKNPIVIANRPGDSCYFVTWSYISAIRIMCCELINTSIYHDCRSTANQSTLSAGTRH